MRTISGSLLAMLLIASTIVTCAQAAAADVSPDISGETNDFAQLLTFIGGIPVSDEQRAQIETEIRVQAGKNPSDVAQADAKIHDVNEKLVHAAGWEQADDRAALRLQVEKLPPSDPTRRIVDANDPVIVSDLEKKRVITEHTLAEWQRACTWMAGLLSVPGPPTNFVVTERKTLKAQYASLSAEQQSDVANVARNFLMMKMLMDGLDPAKRASVIAQARPQALNRDTFAMQLADLMNQSFHVAIRKKLMADSVMLFGLSGFETSMHGFTKQMTGY